MEEHTRKKGVRIIKLARESGELLGEWIKNHTENLFRIAVKNPEYIDAEKAKTGKYVFPFTRKLFDDMAEVTYKNMRKVGISERIIFATRYANEKDDRMMLPSGKKPIGITQQEYDVWLSYYAAGLELYDKHTASR
jgi:hypothetical protein